MTKIKLFHSYLFISNSKNIYEKNNKIYNENNEFICGLLNIPKNKFFSKIILEKNLIKNKQSKKTNTYFEKNNIKVFVEYNIKDNDFTSFYDCNIEQFFNLIKFNYINYLESNENLFNLICINRNANKEIFKKENNIIYQINPNIIKIYNLYFDLQERKITKENNNIKAKLKRNYLVDGKIIYTDCINGTITNLGKYFLSNTTKKILILYDKPNKKIWFNTIKNSNYNFYEENDIIKDIGSNISFSTVECMYKLKTNNFDVIIYDNTKLNHEYFNIKNCKKIYICFDSLYNESEKLKDFIHKTNIIFGTKFECNKITHENLCNLSKIIDNNNFYDIYINKGLINNYKIQDKSILFKNKKELNSQNLINTYLKFNIDKNYDSSKEHYCSICMDVYNYDYVVKTNCNHYYCKNCALKLLNLKYSCSICRTKITKITKTVQKFEDILNENKWYYVGDNNKKVIQDLLSSNDQTFLYFEDKNLFNYFKSILELIPNKLNYKLFLNNIDKYNIQNKQNNLKLFYYKTKKMMKNSEKKIVMMLKNYFNNVSLYQLNIY